MQSISGPAIQMIQTFSIGLMLWYGELADPGRACSPSGTLVAFLSYLVPFYQPVKDLIQVNNVVQQALAAAERIFEFLDEEPDVAEPPGALDLRPGRRGTCAWRA